VEVLEPRFNVASERRRRSSARQSRQTFHREVARGPGQIRIVGEPFEFDTRLRRSSRFGAKMERNAMVCCGGGLLPSILPCPAAAGPGQSRGGGRPFHARTRGGCIGSRSAAPNAIPGSAIGNKRRMGPGTGSSPVHDCIREARKTDTAQSRRPGGGLRDPGHHLKEVEYKYCLLIIRGTIRAHAPSPPPSRAWRMNQNRSLSRSPPGSCR
jgi:hypothetical protein